MLYDLYGRGGRLPWNITVHFKVSPVHQVTKVFRGRGGEDILSMKRPFNSIWVDMLMYVDMVQVEKAILKLRTVHPVQDAHVVVYCLCGGNTCTFSSRPCVFECKTFHNIMLYVVEIFHYVCMCIHTGIYYYFYSNS